MFEKDRQERLEILKKQQEQEKNPEKTPANDVKLSPAEIEKNRIKERVRQQMQNQQKTQNQTRDFER